LHVERTKERSFALDELRELQAFRLEQVPEGHLRIGSEHLPILDLLKLIAHGLETQRLRQVGQLNPLKPITDEHR